MEQLTRERQPQGETTLVEQATTGKQLFNLAIALEDTNWLQNDDKRRTREFVTKATLRIEATRVQCPWWNWSCHQRKNALEEGRAPE